MPERLSFEYTVIRIVPRVERAEFLNAGVVLICRAQRFLGARVEFDRDRITCFTPMLDEPFLNDLEAHLLLIPRIAAADPTAGPIARLDFRERFHWLAAPASTVLQASPAHTGLCTDPAAQLVKLFDELVSVQ